MKLTLALALAFLCSLTHAQVLKSGGVALGLPLHGAYEFILFGGGPQGVNKCPPIQNGFCFTNGEFYLLSNGRTFKGKINFVSAVPLDRNCQQFLMDLTGDFYMPEPAETFTGMSALYTQTMCNLGGNGTSVFDSGGSLVVYLPGFVGEEQK